MHPAFGSVSEVLRLAAHTVAYGPCLAEPGGLNACNSLLCLPQTVFVSFAGRRATRPQVRRSAFKSAARSTLVLFPGEPAPAATRSISPI